MSARRFVGLRPQRARAGRLERTTGFPLVTLALFLVLAVGLGLLISWALGLSVTVQSPTTSSSADRDVAVSTDAEGVTLLSTENLGSEVQLLIDAGTLENPANFDVGACLNELSVNDSVLVLEEVSWEQLGRGWLIVHATDNLGSVREKGGEVSAAVVRSTCGTDSSPGAGGSTLWSGSVLVAPLN